jgi:D-beta-D-heptose 7-phosphate kinase/D-beta-D-heptose 1-phosphate adenosyltransferase
MALSKDEWSTYDNLQKLRNSVETLDSKKVVLVGDVMLDRYVHGFSNNLDPTAAVPVLKETYRQQGAGAAAHVARGLLSLGLVPHLFAVVGDDNAGSELLELLDEEGVPTSGIAVIEGRKTTVKTRLIASRESLINQKQLMLRWDSEETEALDESIASSIIKQACEAVASASVLVISDYGKGVLSDEGAQSLVKAAESAGVPVVSDPKLTGLHRIIGTQVAIMKARGLELMRRRIGAENSAQAATTMLSENQIDSLLVAGGEDGTTLYKDDNTSIHIPCSVENPQQQIGLIDAANVAMTVALAAGLEVVDGCVLANASCEVILSGEATSLETVISARALATRLDEVAWSMHISQR